MTEALPEDLAFDGGSLVEGEDFYMDGPYFVFTAAYHRKRGYCCGSGCKHCPYNGSEEPDPAD